METDRRVKSALKRAHDAIDSVNGRGISGNPVDAAQLELLIAIVELLAVMAEK